MIPKIILIAWPQIDWPTLAKASDVVLGYNPVKPADKSDRQLSDHARLLAVLSAFSDRDSTDPLKSIREAGSLLNHLKFSFLIAADRETIFRISTTTRLDCTPNDSVDGGLAAIVSGTLSEWREATIELCHSNSPMPIRVLMDTVVLQFEKLGLGEVWSDYRKVQLKDKTFRLEHKK